jgi:hypothetical protein
MTGTWLKTPTWRGRFVVAAMVALLMAAACGGDDDSDEGDDAAQTTTTEASTTTTQPPGTEPAAVEPIVIDLLARLDAVTTQIVADPAAVVNDPDSSELAELQEIFAPGDAYDARVNTYRRNAEAGITSTPLNADQVVTTAIVGDLSTLGANSTEASLCILNTYRSSGSSGGEMKDHVAHPGLVTAVRIDGAWKIQQVDMDDTQICDWEEASA